MSSGMCFRVALLVAIVFIGACRNKEPGSKSPVNRLIPAELRAYWDFKPGTYWIYQDSASGLMDTVTVTAYQNDTFQSSLSYDPSISAICEGLALWTEGSNGVDNKFGINTSNASPSPKDYNVVYRTKTDTFGYQGVNTCFVYPLYSGIKAYNDGGLAQDTCQISGLWSSLYGFEQVILVKQNSNGLDDYQPTIAYWAKNIGIIRREYKEDHKVYNLIDYHIEP